MKFMLLMYGDERSWQEATPAQREEVYAQFGALEAELEAAGKTPYEGYELASSREAKVVRKDGSELKVVDGPFSETVEQLGGYYVLDCDSMEEALEWAAKLPGNDAVEVRPLVEYQG